MTPSLPQMSRMSKHLIALRRLKNKYGADYVLAPKSMPEPYLSDLKALAILGLVRLRSSSFNQYNFEVRL